MVQQQQEEGAVLKPPPPAPAAVVFAWDPAAVTKKPATAVAGARVVDSNKQPEPGMSPSPKKPAPPARLLSVPPPPGRAAAAARSLSSRARAVRPEDDPFLAAYLACTKSARNENAKKGRSSRRRFAWAGLGLSCKSSSGAVEQSMVKVANRPELDPRDA